MDAHRPRAANCQISTKESHDWCILHWITYYSPSAFDIWYITVYDVTIDMNYDDVMLSIATVRSSEATW